MIQMLEETFSAQSIREKAKVVARGYLRHENELISILLQIQKAQLFLQWGYPSLFKYAVMELGLAESQAYTLITVSRKCADVPELKVALDSGKLNVSRARRIVSVIDEKNSSFWIEQTAVLPQREMERQVVAVRPAAKVQEKIKPVSESRSMVVFGVSLALEKKLQRVQELHAQSTGNSTSLEGAIEAMADLFLRMKDPVRKAERAAVRVQKKNRAAATSATLLEESSSPVEEVAASKMPSRNTPASPSRQVSVTRSSSATGACADANCPTGSHAGKGIGRKFIIVSRSPLEA